MGRDESRQVGLKSDPHPAIFCGSRRNGSPAAAGRFANASRAKFPAKCSDRTVGSAHHLRPPVGSR